MEKNMNYGTAIAVVIVVIIVIGIKFFNNHKKKKLEKGGDGKIKTPEAFNWRSKISGAMIGVFGIYTFALYLFETMAPTYWWAWYASGSEFWIANIRVVMAIILFFSLRKTKYVWVPIVVGVMILILTIHSINANLPNQMRQSSAFTGIAPTDTLSSAKQPVNTEHDNGYQSNNINSCKKSKITMLTIVEEDPYLQLNRRNPTIAVSSDVTDTTFYITAFNDHWTKVNILPSFSLNTSFDFRYSEDTARIYLMRNPGGRTNMVRYNKPTIKMGQNNPYLKFMGYGSDVAIEIHLFK